MDTRKVLERIVSDRIGNRLCDHSLWSKVDEQTVRLRGFTSEALIERYRSVTTCIVSLVGPATDGETTKARHDSTWWWLRVLFQLDQELARRGMNDIELFDIPDPIPLISELTNTRAPITNHWVKIGAVNRLEPILRKGAIFFRNPDEPILGGFCLRHLEADSTRPLRIFGPKGQIVKPGRQSVYASSVLPFRQSSWSYSMDLRLIFDFARHRTNVDSCIVVWDPDELTSRILETIDKNHNDWRYEVARVQYVDSYEMISTERQKVRETESLNFAYQRELRLTLKTRSPVSAEGFTVTVGPLADIAGIYDQTGSKIAGRGPSSIVRI